MNGTAPDARILGLFQVEAAEHIAQLNADLLELERDATSRDEIVPRVLRSAHSLKGTAAAAGLSRVERLMHNWESCIQAVARDRELSPAAFDLLYRMLDFIEAEVHAACGVRVPHTPEAPTADEVRSVFGAGLELFELEPEAPTPAHAGGPAEPARAEDQSVLRVSVAKVDRLMAQVSELVQVKAASAQLGSELGRLNATLQAVSRDLQRAGVERRAAAPALALASGARAMPRARSQRSDLHGRVADAVEQCARLSLSFRRQSYALDVVSTRLQSDVRSVRMVPAQSLFSTFSRMVRDLARRQGKHAVLRFVDAETEVDRDLLEALREPVMHLLRNAVAHGIEAPEARSAAGKPQEGTVTLAVASTAAGLEITVEDDGRGIDFERVRAVLVESGALSAAQAAELPLFELERYIFQPGFSTASTLDAVSGRGVGLDVVREAVERCGGTVRLSHRRGAGTAFALRLPLNLTTLRVLVVRVAGCLLAVPVNSVASVMRIEREAVRQVDSGPTIEFDGRPVPLTPLADVLGMQGQESELGRLPAVVVEAAGARCALSVDAIDGEQELVIMSLGDYLKHVPCVAGAAVVPGGQIVPALNVASLVRQVTSGPLQRRVFAPPREDSGRRKRVLIVDDSITTRTLEKSILEASGYAVEVATDGQDALVKLREQSFDLMLSDVQMPRMDGIELVNRVRADQGLHELKIVLVSSLSADTDRARGLGAGADAYIGKSEFRQDLLLQTLERLL
jgi:two-component system chemotaxis sensor kinase CheA